MKELKDYSTAELVDELSVRTGVSEIQVDNESKIKTTVEGPAVVLVVVD